MVDSAPYGTPPAADQSGSGKEQDGRFGGTETGGIARLLAAPDTSDYVRTWLGAALGRDMVLAYQEAATLAGILELLACDEAKAWLLPALTAALAGDPATAFDETIEIARALRPAALVMQDLEQCLPEPANSHGAPTGIARGREE
ncbi:hypothetical protein GCM10011611_31190 [Aliidongia dinghuensis]|uniref:Uncharacterized protein n=1 Tax=Aliidongia dinghuensis TaxID=1867774 RepID=A0A8J3E4C0_9PROT|nr:hypothetical protein [Aliidongia dinghuensis]GGF22878.1 hypothetical protein GCM10011611_31190 [Aliidongia dinghuensis]